MRTVLHRLVPCLPSLVLLIASLHCEGADGLRDFEAMTRRCHSVITNPASSDSELLEAISRLGRMEEPPSLWTRVADDPTYGTLHRKRCIMALFRRHGTECETIADLASVLGRPRWLTNSDLKEVAVITGWVPVDMVPGDTVFAITILPGTTPKEAEASSKLRCAVYVRVSGKVIREDFLAFLQHGKREAVGGNAFIEQFGFIDDYGEWLRGPSQRPGARRKNGDAE